jgi:hypothetical protein
MQKLVPTRSGCIAVPRRRRVRHDQIDIGMDLSELLHKLVDLQIREPGVEYHRFRR